MVKSIRSTTLVSLYHVNKMLSKRVRKGERFYLTMIILSSVFLCVFIGIPFLTSLVTFKTMGEKRSAFAMSFYLAFSFDALFTAARFQSGTIVEMVHLATFPIARHQKVMSRLLLLILDYKSIIYLSLGFLFLLFLLKELFILQALLSTISLLLFAVSISAWLSVIEELLNIFHLNWRKNAFVGFFLLLWFFLIANVAKRYTWFSLIPIIGFLGNAMFYLLTNDIYRAFINVAFLLVGCILGVFCLMMIHPRK